MMDDKQVLEELKKEPTMSLVIVSSMIKILEGVKSKGLTTIDEALTYFRVLVSELKEATK